MRNFLVTDRKRRRGPIAGVEGCPHECRTAQSAGLGRCVDDGRRARGARLKMYVENMQIEMDPDFIVAAKEKLTAVAV